MSYDAQVGKHSGGLHYFDLWPDGGPRTPSNYTGWLAFQDGPISEYGVNGTTNEEVIQLLIDRITSLNEMQNRKYACRENSLAITKLEEALHWLNARTAARKVRGVEGTMIP